MGKKIPVFLGLILVVFAVAIQVVKVGGIKDWILRLENLAYDMQLKARLITQRNIPFKTNIAIVDIDDKSLEKEGHWPWPRSKLATLTEHLKAAGAVVIAYDILFSQVEGNIATKVMNEMNQQNLLTPTEKIIFDKITPTFDTDKQFGLSLNQVDNVFGISFLPEKRTVGVLPPPLLVLNASGLTLGFIKPIGFIGINPILAEHAQATGFINAFADEDGVIRHAPLLIRYQNGLYPSLALKAVQSYLLSNVSLITASYGKSIRLEGIRLGSASIPTNQRSEVIIPYRGPSYTFPYFSATDVLANHFPKSSFEGKIVFVGSTATALGDVKATPVQKVFPGIEINATIADALVKNNFSNKPTWALGAEVSMTVLLGIIFVLLFPYFGPLTLTFCIFLFPTLLIFLNDWFVIKTGIILSILIPVVLIIFLAVLNMVYGYFFETRQRARLKDIFGQYVPPEHIETMMKSKGDYGLYGEDRDMSVLFADIRGFTTISESMTASQIKKMLDQFFTPMTEIIFKYHGTIDKYIGDLIMAFWGAPIKTDEHAEQALYSALDMQKKVTELKPVFKEAGWPEINIGIGVNTGEMSIGDMGSKFRRNYTVLGDSVNLGSRIESLSKYYDVKIITSEFTIQGQEKIAFRFLDRVQVKGKKTGVALYEVICRKEELTQEQKEELALYQTAVDFYYQQEWTKAQSIFVKLKESDKPLHIYDIYLQRIEEFMQTPPDKNWSGVYVHLSK